ncbi:MAG: hypothetical protein GF408_00825 [Candidatus Omnitrophica bacterium]|nr:hypothetical protein [Candidatus Omnitrophota bacterium]
MIKTLCMMITGLSICAVCGCAGYKGSVSERKDVVSRVDETLEEKHMEDAGAPEYIK